MAKHDRTGRSKGDARHVRLYEHIEKTPAWRDLSGLAAKAWVSIGLMHNGSNNGSIAVSARELGSRIGVHHSSAARAILELERAGFLRCTKAEAFRSKTASRYRLTHLRDDMTGEPPSKEYNRQGSASRG